MSNLKVLNIASNHLKGQKSAKLIAEIIKRHKGIIELDASHNPFYSGGLSLILLSLVYLSQTNQN